MIPWKPIASAAGVAAALAALYLGREPASQVLVAAGERIEALGPWAPAAFIGLYVVGILALLPATPFLLAAGALFGLLEGAAWGLVANTLAGVVAFVVARRLARSFVERKLERVDELEALDRAIRKGGLRTTFLIRMSPLLPASLINYGLGLTSVRLGHYLAATLATVPTVFLYVYYGKALGDLTLLGGGRQPERGAAYYGLLLAGVAATFVVTAAVTRRAKRILEREGAG